MPGAVGLPGAVMRHYIYRDLGAILLLAIDAEDDADADRKFRMFRGYSPKDSQYIYFESCPCVSDVAGLPCALPHNVGDRTLIVDRLNNPINHAPKRLPQVKLFPGVTIREFHSQCFYCGIKLGKKGPSMRTEDHLTPRSRGGRNANNKVPACHQCNQLKGHLKLEEYRVLVAYRNGLIPIEILQQIKFKGEEMTGQYGDVE